MPSALHAVGALQNSVRRDLGARRPCGAEKRQREGDGARKEGKWQKAAQPALRAVGGERRPGRLGEHEPLLGPTGRR